MGGYFSKVIKEGVAYYIYKSEYKDGKITLYLCKRDGQHVMTCRVDEVVHCQEQTYITHVWGIPKS